MEYLDDINFVVKFGKDNGFILDGMVEIICSKYGLVYADTKADIKLLLGVGVMLNGKEI